MKKILKKGFTIVELVIVIAVIAILTAVLVPTISSVVRKAQVSADTQLIRNLNTALKEDEAFNKGKKPATMHEALEIVAADGYIVARINNAKATENKILWDSVNNVFVYLDKDSDKPKYTPDVLNKKSVEDYQYWTIASEPDTTFSTYLYKANKAAYENVSTGIDVGDENITSITYKNTGNAKDVVVRTNSANTNLTIDDASTGKIYHYGAAGALNIIQCHTSSYHENGKVAFAEIAKGRIVLESGSEIKHIHVDKKTNASFDTVIIADNGAKALPEKITRDEVTVETETLVVKVESNGATEEVYVYADGNTGSTEKVTEGDNKQNENINSALGQLVLDNGSESKALSQDIKEAEKTTSVQEAVTKEVEQEIEEDEYALYEARIGKKGYYSLRAALEAASAGDSVVLLKDADLVTEYGITKSLTIYGSGHTVRASSATGAYGSNREGRVFDISDTSGLNVSFVNIRVQGEATGVRGISLYGNTNLNLTLSECSVSSNYYAINVASANTNLHVTLKNNTFSTGYCAIQSWSPNAVFDVLGGTLEGNNDKTYNAEGWNDFSTIVLNSAATNNTWNFKNVTIKASSTTGNKETLFSNRTTGSIVSFENCKFVSNDVELTELQDIVNNCHFSALPSSMKINGTELIRQADAYYTNAGAVFANGDITSASPSDELNTYFEYPFVQGWLAPGEGVKLLSDVELSSNITLQLTEGSIYLIFNGHTISGGKIVLQGTASVISEVGTMSGVFEGSVSVTDNGNGSFTYSLAA